AIGVFDYSDEEGTEAATLSHKIAPVTIGRRYAKISGLAERLCAQRAAGRIGSVVEILIDGLDEDGNLEGRAAHQAPEVDGSTTLVAGALHELDPGTLHPGDLVEARIVGSAGADLIAVPVKLISAAPVSAASGATELG
ncbi:MAG: 30S ribosomal protein S12 methylthiotransferase RimO, partial [Micromonosporaceae bacterium]|nr:30S ribosomal protein S12 methylthiotransferase RimO [Micromonosporaceae bacterium]